MASAPSSAFLPLLAECETFVEFEGRALELSRRSTAEAIARSLEASDRELASSRPLGSAVHAQASCARCLIIDLPTKPPEIHIQAIDASLELADEMEAA